jgi:WG containing repeat
MVVIGDDDGTDKLGFIDRLGHFRIRPKFIPLYPLSKFSEGLAAVNVDVDAKPVFIDKQGKIVLQPHADSLSAFHEGLARAEKNGKFGFIDRSGNWAIPPTFEFAEDFSEGLAPVGVELHKLGFIDKTGHLIVPAIYQAAQPFTEGLAPVTDAMLFSGYINRQGKLGIPMQFDRAEPFQSGFAAVETSEDYASSAARAVPPPVRLKIANFNKRSANCDDSAQDTRVEKRLR